MARTKNKENDAIACEAGSGNVFADIGVKNPEEALIKAELAAAIGQLIRKLKMTQVQAAEKLGIDQPKVSLLLAGRLRDFSIERLLRFVTALEQDIRIVISPRKKKSGRRERVHVEMAV